MLYQEIQNFRSKLILGFLLIMTLIVIMIEIYSAPSLFAIIETSLLIGIAFVLVLTIKLIVNYSEKEISFYFSFNLAKREILWANVARVKFVHYGVWEYGYGYRYSEEEKLIIYNSSGNDAIVITDNSGNRFFIGVKDKERVKNVLTEIIQEYPNIELIE